jgi:hypothetical protein
MLPGFNTNFRHRGVLFHVQTEDSGRSSPHVITHLFHGGNIIASQKTSYSDKLESGDVDAEVKALMESQHKKMLKELSRSGHDTAILQRLGADVFGETVDASETMPPPPVAQIPDAPTPSQTVPQAPTEPQLPTEPQGSTPAATAVEGASPESPKERLARAFGEGVVSQKPLDEVVLDYLVENARKRKRSAK